LHGERSIERVERELDELVDLRTGRNSACREHAHSIREIPGNRDILEASRLRGKGQRLGR
jgi:hypothetical protein